MAIVNLSITCKRKETMNNQTTTMNNDMEKVKALADKAGLCPSPKFDYLSRNEKRAIKTKLKKRKLL